MKYIGRLSWKETLGKEIYQTITMLRTHYAKDLKEGKTTVAGWVHEKRILGSIVFLVLRDFTGLVQVTAKKGVADEKLFELLKDIKRESVLAVSGTAVANRQAPNGLEVVPSHAEVLSLADNLPIDISPGINTALDKRLDWRSIDLRKPENRAIFKVQSTLLHFLSRIL
jgi:aspartyl/asparaginyl-tRNA synthetase